jgi:hypothetical protein
MTDPHGTGDPPMSYAEKYRGTEWGRPEPAMPPPRPRGPRRALIVAVLAIVAAAAGIGALALSPTLPLANLGAAPSHGAGSASVDHPTPSPTPSPTSDPGATVKARLWAVVSAPDLSYRMTGQGKTVLDRKTYQTFVEKFVVVGDDYSGTLKGTPKGPYLMGIRPSQIRSALVARKGGMVYLKEKGSLRSAYRSSARADRLVPFMYIDLAGAIDYVKPVTMNGRHLHLLRTNRFYRPDIARLLDMGEFAGVPDSMGLDLYVTDDGLPVSAVFTMDVRYHDQFGGAHHLAGRSTYAFTDFGSPLKVVVPKR